MSRVSQSESKLCLELWRYFCRENFKVVNEWECFAIREKARTRDLVGFNFTGQSEWGHLILVQSQVLETHLPLLAKCWVFFLDLEGQLPLRHKEQSLVHGFLSFFPMSLMDGLMGTSSCCGSFYLEALWFEIGSLTWGNGFLKRCWPLVGCWNLGIWHAEVCIWQVIFYDTV